MGNTPFLLSLLFSFMKHFPRVATGCLMAAFVFFYGGQAAFAAVSNWQTGASIAPRWSEDFGSDTFKQSLQNLRATSANAVTLIVPYYQSNIYSTDIHAGSNTPTDSSLAAGIDQAHALGFTVSLKPHLESDDGQWRAFINPSDRQAWFTAYGNMLQHLGQLGAQHGLEQIVMGTELADMSSASVNGTNTQNWRSLIGALRGVFHGQLTYSAQHDNPDEKDQIQFWDALDVIGISAYHPLQGNSVDELKQSWDQWNNTAIRPLQQRYGKPVIFTEVGYKSVGGSHTEPGAWWMGGGIDMGEQARDYEALYSYWNDQPSMQGVSWWDWSSDPNAGGSGDTNYTPQHKDAEGVMKKWNTNSTAPNPSPNPSPNPNPPPANSGPQSQSYSISAGVNPQSPSVGQSVAASVTVKNTDGSLNGQDIIVDIEIYNAQGQKQNQQFMEHQAINAQQSHTYTVNWTVPSAGTYTVKVGIFNASWTTNYLWSDSAVTFATASPSQPPPSGANPPPASHTLDIWWPADSSHLSGLQPFKAMLENMNLSDYTMYWQVDNDQLNQMGDSNQDYPHKESNVDVTSWNWNGNHTYTLTFIAKDKSGNEITRKAVTVLVGG